MKEISPLTSGSVVDSCWEIPGQFGQEGRYCRATSSQICVGRKAPKASKPHPFCSLETPQTLVRWAGLMTFCWDGQDSLVKFFKIFL